MSSDADGTIEAFDLLSNEVRFDILRALGEAMAEGDAPLSFTDLQRRVGVDDNGRFNYHLTKLADRLVAKHDGGYELEPPGNNIYRAIVAGAYTADADTDPVPVEGEHCPHCGGAAAAWYADSQFHLGCLACDTLLVRYPIPSGSFDRDRPESLLAAGGTYIFRDQASMWRGRCPHCAGEVASRLAEEGAALEEFDEYVYSSIARFACRRCSWSMHCGVPFAVQIEPAVVSFFDDHDLGVFDRRPWSIYQYAEDRVLSRNPWRIEVRCRIEDELLRIVVDGDVEVIEAEVEPAT